ncbi:Cation/H+ exchanger [Suillus subluteus]|nr:Cation/H+ exchanger [Suillus subluteus]
MALDLLQVSPPGPSYICLGGFTVLVRSDSFRMHVLVAALADYERSLSGGFSLVSLLIKEKLYVNEVVLGTVFGIIIGPFVTNIFAPRSWGSLSNTITLEVMRIVLAIGLFAAGVELPRAYMKKHAKSLLVMVVPTMAFGWVVVAAVIHTLFPKLDYISALCIAACLTPTDPVTCAAITHGKFAKKHVPEDIRHILLAEAAANDGLAYPFLSISIYLTTETSVRTAIGKWFLVGWLYQVILGTVLGASLGFLFSKLMVISHSKRFIDRESYIAQYLTLSIFTMGVASTIGADDLLAAFAAGCAISWDGHFHKHTEDVAFFSIIDYVLNCCCFIYIGAWLPFSAYDSPEYGITPRKLVLLVIAIMALRRIPFLLAVYKLVPEIKCWQEALFSGHFGKQLFYVFMASLSQVSESCVAVFVSALALTRLPTPENPPADQAQYLAATIQPIVSFVVLGSIIVHGLSIPFFNVSRIARSRTTSLSKASTDHTLVADPIC